MDEVGKLIKNRFEVADINRTNMVHFTPSDRRRIRSWIDERQEIVRCKDCKNRKEEWWNCPCRDWADDDFFCASGKPKEGDGDG